MIKINFFEVLTKWTSVLNAARTTVGKDSANKEPPSIWKKKILLAEHSPIRLLIINWKWSGIKYWVSVHFVRHKIGIEHFVKTQRSDRTGLSHSRGDLTQDSEVDHECTANAQSIINISRKRLCSAASKETREAWQLFLEKLREKEPELVSVCVRECTYRGFCPELMCCGYVETEAYNKELKSYRSTSLNSSPSL
jgi:hypothetical protein